MASPVDLKKILRQRMLSLLKNQSSSTDTPTSQNKAVQDAFTAFLEEKRKTVDACHEETNTEIRKDSTCETAEEVSTQSKSTYSRQSFEKMPDGHKIEAFKISSGKTADNSFSQPTEELHETINETGNSEAHQSPSKCLSGTVASNACSAAEHKNFVDASTHILVEDKLRLSPNFPPSSKKPRYSTASTDLVDTNDLSAASSLPSSAKSKKENSHHTSIKKKHSKKSKHKSKKHEKRSSSSKTGSRDRRHKDEKHKRREKEHSSRHSSTHKHNREHAEKQIKKSSDKKKRKRNCSSKSSQVFDESGVDTAELEKFVDNLIHKSQPPSSSKSKHRPTSYHSTFKRYPSPPTRRHSSRHLYRVMPDLPSNKNLPLPTYNVRPVHTTNSSKSETKTTLGKSLEEFTDMCRQMAEQDKKLKRTNDTAETETDSTKKTGNVITLKIKDAKQLKAKSQVEQMQAQYPVSSGMDHFDDKYKTEQRQSKVQEMSPEFRQLIQRRMEAVRWLSQNSSDPAALTIIEECDDAISSWTKNSPQSSAEVTLTKTLASSTDVASQYAAMLYYESQVCPDVTVAPGPVATVTSAWQNSEYLHKAAVSKMDIGRKLLEKHGWSEGQGLGKDLSGQVESVPPSLKFDRKGLHADDEVVEQNVIARPLPQVGGKHPVSALNEHCSRKRWGPPMFNLVSTFGPNHRQSFIMNVTVNKIVYQPTSASQTKKEAKALAAALCLQTLGLWKSNEES